MYTLLPISALLVASSSAFSPLQTPYLLGNQHQTQHPSSSLLRSEPSDTGNDPYYDDDVLTVESQEFEESAGETLVNKVFDMLPSGSIGEVSEEKRSQINEVLLKLERLNPTAEPAVSPLLNGVWELKYSGGYVAEGALPSPTRQLALFLYSGGYSPGLFALSLAQKLPSNLVSVGDLEISISRAQPRVEAKVDVKAFGSMTSTIEVKARLEVESELRLKETYESATVMDRVVELPQALQYSRELYVTYVDEDLLLVRDGSGVPELLMRKEKSFSDFARATEPGDDSLSAPGEK